MRAELEYLENIDRYLDGKMDEQEKRTYEERLKNHPQLRNDLETQKLLRKAIRRIGLKQKIQRVKTRLKWRKRFLRGGGALVLGALVFTGAWSFQHNNSSLQGMHGYSEEMNLAENALPAQNFILNNKNDTVLETKGGIVFSIPRNAFQNKAGKNLTGPFNIKIREALGANDIVKAGLSTESNNRLLETAGMFSLEAYGPHGDTLEIKNSNPILAAIPTDSVRENMKLFHGVKDKDGKIDWRDPKNLDNSLTPVDISQLDFYPPGFLDTLSQVVDKPLSKQQTDSVFYSFSCGGEYNVFEANAYGRSDTLGNTSNYSGPTDSTISVDYLDVCNYVTPAMIKSIWNLHYQNTNLSTREFSERMPWIYRSHDKAILEVYIKHIDQPLYVSDSIAMNITSGLLHEVFQKFYQRRNGKVDISTSQARELNSYFVRKSQLYEKIIRNMLKRREDKELKIDSTLRAKNNAHFSDDLNRKAANYTQEWVANYKSVCHQLGIKPIDLKRNNYYRVQVTATGWCNVDRFVSNTTDSRKTATYADQKGKTAILIYHSISIDVDNVDNYDRVLPYLTSKQLKSFVRMDGKNGHFEYSMNDLFNYNLICLAYKGDKVFAFSQQHVENTDNIEVKLESKSGDELDELIDTLSFHPNTNSHIQKDLKYFEYVSHTEAIQRKFRLDQEKRTRLFRVIFPASISQS